MYILLAVALLIGLLILWAANSRNATDFDPPPHMKNNKK